MPFKSEAQAKYMFANHPEIAKEFAQHTDFKYLPKKVKKVSKVALKEHIKKLKPKE